MYILLNEKNELMGFSDVKDENCKNIEITKEEHNRIMSLQSQGILWWDKTEEIIKVITLGQFENINEKGEIIKDTDAELKYYKGMHLTLRRERVQLKKEIKDFEEVEEDTAELKEQLEIKETEIKETENKIKELEG